MRIYYAHSMRIYNQPQEQEELTFIRQQYPDAIIINPNGDLVYRGSMQVYFNAIDTCDLVIASQYKDHIGKGVYLEIEHAQAKQCSVLGIWKEQDQLKLCPVEKIIYADPSDWKVYYGKMIAKQDRSLPFQYIDPPYNIPESKDPHDEVMEYVYSRTHFSHITAKPISLWKRFLAIFR